MKRSLWPGLTLLLLALLAAPEAFAVVIGIRVAFNPPAAISPASTLSGELQLYRQPTTSTAPTPIGEPRAVGALPVGGAVLFEVSQPSDPIYPGDPMFLSFAGSILVPAGTSGTLVLPAYAVHPTDPIAPTPPDTAPLVPAGLLQAGATASVRIAGWSVSGPFVAASAAVAVRADAGLADLVIDDFRSGQLARHNLLCDLLDLTRGGTMAGGTRRMRLIVNQPPATCDSNNPLRQSASLQVVPPGPLVVSTGFKTFHRLELNYGQDRQNNNAPLNLDLTRRGINDRIRVTFDGSDLVESFNIVLFTGDGTGAATIASCGMNMQPRTNPFSVDFPLAKFRSGTGAPDFSDVDFIAVVLQSGSAVGANDFALRSIVATTGGAGAVQECE